MHPSAYTRRSPNLACNREDDRIIGTSISPPSAVPIPTSHGPPPSLAIFSEMKFHAALNPVHTRNSAARNPQNRGAARNTAPIAPSLPSPEDSCFGASRATTNDQASTPRLAIA